MALRCLYTDLDGTLLGKDGNLFGDADGNFSRSQALMLEACHRAGVEVVIMSGRKEDTVRSDARLIGQTSYIYEAGCAMVIDRERTYLTGEWLPSEEGSPAERIESSGIPTMLFERFDPLLEWHEPWHTGRELSLLFRGKVDVEEVNELIIAQGDAGRDLRFLDNGAIGRPMAGVEVTHAYHLVPGGASKGKAVGAHMRARGYAPEECIAAGDSLEDLGAAEYVSRFFCMANGVEKDPMLREAAAGMDNVTVTEGRMGEGVYEAVVSTLAGPRRVTRGGPIALAALTCGLALVACGDDEGTTVVNASGADAQIAEAIQDELDLYREPIDLSILPPDQQAQVGEVLDQFPQAAGTVTELTVDDGVVEAKTGLEPGGDSPTTARLICGAIIRGGGERSAPHLVIGSSGETIAECAPDDVNYP